MLYCVSWFTALRSFIHTACVFPSLLFFHLYHLVKGSVNLASKQVLFTTHMSTRALGERGIWDVKAVSSITSTNAIVLLLVSFI